MIVGISVLKCGCEPSESRLHQYSCGFQCDKEALEGDTQWVRGKTARFSFPSTLH
jgi:hypothetical protein